SGPNCHRPYREENYIMCSNPQSALVLAAWLLVPPALLGQTVERKDTQSLRPAAGQPAVAAEDRLDRTKVAQKIIAQTNALRREEKQPEVKSNAKLTETAQ